MGQGGIGGFQRDVGPASHRNADGSRFHCRSVVDTVANHRQRRLSVEMGNGLHLIFRQESCFKFETQFTGNGGRRTRVITGQDHAFHANLIKLGDSAASVVAQRVL